MARGFEAPEVFRHLHATTKRNGNGGQMKLIDISTQRYPNVYTIVDDEDFEYLDQWKWSMSYGYVIRGYSISGIKKNIQMHRVLVKPERGFMVDHINGNPLDNRKENLRICTNSENSRNRHKIKERSLPKGVFWRKDKKRYYAQIMVNYKNKHLGGFRTIEEASIAYNEAAIKYHGNFASLSHGKGEG